jgi:phytoene synthase
VSDDLVDGSATGDRRRALAEWRRLAREANPPSDRPVALAWAHTRMCHRIPLVYVEQLLDGVARDLEPTHYRTFDELATYCYAVASTVGLMAMHITGFSGPAAIPYAVKLGVALQLTNILRDVGEDWRAGRCYLPQDELAAHGLGRDDLADGRLDARWQAFLAFQIERTRRLYSEALPGVALLHPDGRFAIAAAAELYCGILDDIEEHGGDVFRRRAFITRGEKLRRLPGIWWRAVSGSYGRATRREDACAEGDHETEEGGR